MGRWFFKCFQQRIEAVRRKHVHFVDQINLVPPLGRRIKNVIKEITGIFDFGSGCRIDFYQIDKSPLIQLPTGGTGPARLRTFPALTVDRLGQNSGNRGLPDASGAGKKIRVMQSIVAYGVQQRTDHMILADDFVEFTGSPLTG